MEGQMEGGGLGATEQSLPPRPALTLRNPEERGRHLSWQIRYREGLQKFLCHCPIPGNVRNITEHILFGAYFVLLSGRTVDIRN